MPYVENEEQAVWFLKDVLRWIGAYYGGTTAMLAVAQRLKELQKEMQSRSSAE